METEEELRESLRYGEEEAYPEESILEEQGAGQEETAAEEATEKEQKQEEYVEVEQEQAPETYKLENQQEEDRSSFTFGLSVGLGIGCITTFVIMWISVFFSPRLPSNITYEAMLTVFVYPLIYLLTVGLIALTAGIVREYYMKRRSF